MIPAHGSVQNQAGFPGVGNDDPVWDVAVVGAGPAGCLAALLAARAGLRVVLFEKESFPRYKVCGCCINGAALACLKNAGLGDLPSRLGATPLKTWVLACQKHSAQLALPTGIAVSRAAFDAALAQAAVQAGTLFRPACRVELEPAGKTPEARVLRVHAAAGEESTAARLILATGGLSALQAAAEAQIQTADSQASTGFANLPGGSYLGVGRIAETAPAFYAPGCVYMCCAPQGYVGWVRIEDGRMNFAAALDPVQVKRSGGVAACIQAMLTVGLPSAWPSPSQAEKTVGSGCWRGTSLLSREPAVVAEERLFILGDQAGYVEPFTGEGIAWALESALRVMPFVAAVSRAKVAGNMWDPDWTAGWAAAQRTWRAPRQRLCRWVAGCLRYPVVVRTAMRLLGGLPRLANPLLQQLNAAPAGIASD